MRPPALTCNGDGDDEIDEAQLSLPQFPSPQTLTKAALTQYKGSALESGRGTGNEVEDGQLIHLLSVQMQRGPRAESAQMIVNVAQLLARSPHNARALIAALPHLLSGMQRHLDHKGLQESGVGLLGNLACSSTESPLALLRSGCLHHVIQCLQRHADDAGVQRNAYRCLRNVASAAAGGASAECAAFLVESRVPQLVCFLLHRHVENERVQQQALACVWSFACCSESLARLLSQIAAADGVLRVLARHPDCAEVQRVGCGMLTQLLDACDDAADDDEAECIPLPTARPMPPPAEMAPAALAAAAAHPSSANVQAGAMELLAALARSQRAPRLRPKQLLEGLRHGRAALEALGREAAVVVAVCELYEEALSLEALPAEAQERVVQECASQATPWISETRAVLPQLYRALRHEAADEGTQAEVAEAACSLLGRLCTKACLGILVETGAVGVVTSLAHRSAHDPAVFGSALRVLRCVASLNPSATVEAFLDANGLGITLRGMRLHAAHLRVQEAGCSLLWSCALQPVPHARLLPSSDEVQATLTPLLIEARYCRHVPLQRQLGGLLFTLSLQPYHGRALCAPRWLRLLTRGSAPAYSVNDARVQEYACATLANLLSRGSSVHLVSGIGGSGGSGSGSRSVGGGSGSGVDEVAAGGGALVATQLSAATRLHLVALAAGAMRLGFASEDTAALAAGTRLLRRVSAANCPLDLLRHALRADLPSLLWRALREAEAAPATQATPGLAEHVARDAAVAVHALLAATASRQGLARVADPLPEGGALATTLGQPLPLPAAFRALLAAHALARPWLPSAAESEDSSCWLLPLPLACGMAPPASTAAAATDWRLLITGRAAGARPCIALGAPVTAVPASSPLPAAALERLESLAEEVQLLILAHAAADLLTLLAALATCSRWRRLLKASDVTRRIDLSEYADGLRSGALSLRALCRMADGGPLALSLCEVPPAVLEQALPSCVQLRTLDLSQCALPNADIRRVAERCPRLQVLDLSGSEQLDDSTLAALGGHAAHLTALGLNGCIGITDGGLAALATGTHRLRALHLFGCVAIGEVGVRSVAEKCECLEVVDLTASGGATDAAVLALASLRGSTLRALGAGGGHLSDATLAAIAASCGVLETLLLPNVNGFTCTGSAALLRACPLRAAVFAGCDASLTLDAESGSANQRRPRFLLAPDGHAL